MSDVKYFLGFFKPQIYQVEKFRVRFTFSQSGDLKSPKFSCPVGPNHGGASFDFKLTPTTLKVVPLTLDVYTKKIVWKLTFWFTETLVFLRSQYITRFFFIPFWLGWLMLWMWIWRRGIPYEFLPPKYVLRVEDQNIVDKWTCFIIDIQ